MLKSTGVDTWQAESDPILKLTCWVCGADSSTLKAMPSTLEAMGCAPDRNAATFPSGPHSLV